MTDCDVCGKKLADEKMGEDGVVDPSQYAQLKALAQINPLLEDRVLPLIREIERLRGECAGLRSKLDFLRQTEKMLAEAPIVYSYGEHIGMWESHYQNRGGTDRHRIRARIVQIEEL